MNKKLLALIQKHFEEKLAGKTGWGKNEVLIAYKEAVSEALLEIMDEAQQTNI